MQAFSSLHQYQPAMGHNAHASIGGQFGTQGRLAIREKAPPHTYKWMRVSGPFHMRDCVAYLYIFIAVCLHMRE